MLEGQRRAGCGPLSPQTSWWQACSKCRIAQSADPAGQATITLATSIPSCYYYYYYYQHYHYQLLLCAASALPAGLPPCPSELLPHVICNQQPAMVAQRCSRRRTCLRTTCWACLYTAIPCAIPCASSKCTKLRASDVSDEYARDTFCGRSDRVDSSCHSCFTPYMRASIPPTARY